MPFKKAAPQIFSKSLKNWCERNLFFWLLLLATQLKNLYSQIFFKDIDQNWRRTTFENSMQKTAFCSAPTCRIPPVEYCSRTTYKAKYEKAIHNSVKCCHSYEKLQLILLNISTKILFSNKIEQTIFFQFSTIVKLKKALHC